MRKNKNFVFYALYDRGWKGLKASIICQAIFFMGVQSLIKTDYDPQSLANIRVSLLLCGTSIIMFFYNLFQYNKLVEKQIVEKSKKKFCFVFFSSLLIAVYTNVIAFI